MLRSQGQVQSSSPEYLQIIFIVKPQQSPGRAVTAAGGAAADEDPLRALSFILSTEFPESNHLKLAKITALLVHEANHNHLR